MKILLSVLREMADLPDDPQVISDALNTLGLAVESVDVVGVPVPGVVSARILRTEKHPDAAKVTRCWVDAGDGMERHVWCGATNMGPGDIVPLATLGTTMPDGREILKRGILGIDSEGMLCSAVELGIAEDAAGLLILPPDSPLGTSPFSILGLEHDVVFDLDLTRNRPDCWGHMGVARDLAAHFGVTLHGPQLDDKPLGVARSVPVTISAPDRCGMFSVTVISGVTVGESPVWVANRLARLGMRSISNVVDASNLVMLELNQPNHAYDHSVVGSFDVRLARDGETHRTLDDVDRKLSPNDLLICNGGTGEAVGIAGIMGGLDSEVTPSTSELALEVAWFSPDPIRFSVNRHNLRSEASVRFERGVDPEGVDTAVRRFVAILRETCPNVVLHAGTTRETTPAIPVQSTVEVRTARVQRSLGISPDGDRMRELIGSIGFGVQPVPGGANVTIPTFRPDCVDEIDIVEEIARHHGYDALGKSVPKSAVHGRLSLMQQRRRLLRRVLVGMGLDEVMPMPFLAPGDLASMGLPEDNVLHIANPLVAEESVLRTSLRPGLLRALRYNQSHRATRIGLWEIGHVYPKGANPLPDESEQLGIVVAGAGPEVALEQWNAICDALSVGANLEQSKVPAGLHPTRSASLTRGKKVVGVVGEIDPVVLDSLGIEGRVSVLELDLTTLLNEEPKPTQAREVNRHPSSDIDLAFVLGDDVPAQTLHRALRQAAGKRLVGIEMFDVYRGAGVAEGRRSLAFRLRLQEASGTLTDAAIAEVQTACAAAAAKVGAELRA